MNNAIKKAKEAGWTPVAVHSYYSFEDYTTQNKKVPITSILLDPLFWKALNRQIPEWNESIGWIYHWHRFIDHIADGKNIEGFFESNK